MNVVLIGAGYWGSKIARVFNESKDFNLVAIVESDISKHLELEKKYPSAKIFQHLSTCWDYGPSQIDVVAIVSPPDTHFALAKNALEHDKHVFVSKPFVNDTAQCEELYALAEERGKTIFVDYTFLFHSGILELKRQLYWVGKIRQITSQRMGWGLYSDKVSVIEDLMPHDLSVLRFLLDKKYDVSLTDVIRNRNLNNFNDSVYCKGLLPNFATVEITNSWSSPVKTRLLTIVGDKGCLVFDDMSTDKVKFYAKSVKYQRGKFIYEDGINMTFPLENKESLKAELEEYRLFLNDKKKQKYYNNINQKVVKDLQEIVEWAG